MGRKYVLKRFKALRTTFELGQIDPCVPQIREFYLVNSNKSAHSKKPRIFADVPPLVSACLNIIFEGAKESTLLKFSQF